MIATHQLRSTLAEISAVRLAVLFGSAARGTDTPRSVLKETRGQA